LNVGSLRELVELVRANPNKFNWAAANGNADFLMSGFLKSNGLEMAKVPYRDILQAPNDLAENRIQLLSSSLAIVTPLMQAGKVKVLAVTSRQRAPSAPATPTVAEAGYPELALDSPVGLFGPRGMRLELRRRIADELKAVVAADPVIRPRIESTGQLVAVAGPEEFAAVIAELRRKLAETATILGVKSTQ
jgi:tripartite-type tricarboxylate transporter receptor subunit TctC